MINIRSLLLEYSNPALSQGKLERDILRDDWDVTQSTFANDANSDFVVHVHFEALDDPEDSVFESFEPPPAIAAFFDTSSGHVTANSERLAEVAACAFEPEEEKQKEKSQAPSESTLPNFLDLAFGQGKSSSDIGAAPDPRNKFPRVKQHPALLKYYDNFDVTTEEGRRNWQHQMLMKLTKNAQVAAVKLDKLPKSLSKEQSSAIEEAQFTGERMAQEKEDGTTVSLVTCLRAILEKYLLS
jgi:hypothetical protein